MTWDGSQRERSYTCNGELLRERRMSLGWTQEVLAEKSGYSVRLIAKAEASNSVRASTIEHLAETLSTQQDTLLPADLVTNPKELAAEFVRNLLDHEGDVAQKSRHFLADDILFTMPGNPEILPFAGVHVGIDAMDKACRLFFETLVLRSLETLALVAEGNQVVACLRATAGLRGLPEEYDGPALLVLRMTFERGKIVRFHDDYDADRAEQAITVQRELAQQLKP